MYTCKTPGKIILFGEHAVVYGQPAIAIPVSHVEATATIEPSFDSRHRLVSKNVGLDVYLEDAAPDFWGYQILAHVKTHLGITNVPGFTLTISSSIPAASGLGSGAAVAIASVRAISKFLGQPLPNQVVNEIAFEIEKIHHGTPSGVDNTVITYNRPVFFTRNHPIEVFKSNARFTLIIGDTGQPGKTAKTVGEVRENWLQNPVKFEKIFHNIGSIVRDARKALESGQADVIGPLMNANHTLLRDLNVSSEALDRLVGEAIHAGATGAKMSGGGRGGNMIAVATNQQAVETIQQALIQAGAANTITTVIGA